MPSFDAQILALSPDVYWRMDDPVITVSGDPCLDQSGNGNDGVYRANVTPQQPSIVPSNPNAISVNIIQAEYPTVEACARDQSNNTWWNYPAISVSLCFRKNNLDFGEFGVYLWGRDLTLNSHRQARLRIRAGAGSTGELLLDWAVANTWYDIWTSGLSATHGINIVDGGLHIATCIVDLPSSRQEIWVDGVLVGSDTMAGVLDTPTGTYMAVGQCLVPDGHSVNGDISHFVFGGRAWNSAEIQALHAAWATSQILPPTPLPLPVVCSNTCPPGTAPTGDSITCIPKP